MVQAAFNQLSLFEGSKHFGDHHFVAVGFCGQSNLGDGSGLFGIESRYGLEQEKLNMGDSGLFEGFTHFSLPDVAQFPKEKTGAFGRIIES